MNTKKLSSILLFCVFAFISGAVVGVIVWAFMALVNRLISGIWTTIPVQLGWETGISSLLYALIICLALGLVIGLWQKKFGLYPDELEVVLYKSKHGGYPYNNLPAIFVAAILPLAAGGALGPEAGLSGLVAGLCCFVGAQLKNRSRLVLDLAEVNMAAVLSIIFRTPLLGLAANLEPEIQTEKKVKKPVKIIVYLCAIFGGILVYEYFGHLGGGSSFPRFSPNHAFGFDQLKWYPLIIVIGVIAAWFYMICDKITLAVQKALTSPVIRSLLAGTAVAIIGWLVPASMFSGEHQLHELMSDWGSYAALTLLVIALAKLFLVNTCINLGWHGGSIFPIIFAGCALGYAFAVLTGMDGALAVAVMVASIYAHIKKKPLMASVVLLLCFPITYVIPIFIAAFIAAKIPSPKWLLKEESLE